MMTRWYGAMIPLVGLLVVPVAGLGACTKTPAAPTPQVALEPAPRAATGQNAVSPSFESSGGIAETRRARKGLEEVAPKDAAAESEAETEAEVEDETLAKRPPASETPQRVALSKRARAAVLGPWTDAWTGQEPTALAGLLAEDFGSVSEEPNKDPSEELQPTVLRDAFIATASKTIRQKVALVIGPMVTRMQLTPEITVDVTFSERRTVGKRCEEAVQSLSLRFIGDAAPVVYAHSRGIPAACSARDPATIAAAHEGLKTLFEAPDGVMTALTQMNETVQILRHGYGVGSLSRTAIDGPSGDWLVGWILSLEAEFENTHSFGTVGIIRHPNGAELIYKNQGGAWRLNAVDLADTTPNGAP